MIVVDTNVIAYYWLRGEFTDVAHRIRLRDPDWHVPVLWRSEMRSILAGHLRRGAIDEDLSRACMAVAEGDLVGHEHHVSSEDVLRLVTRSNLSAYDCEFVALAKALGRPLVTEDRAILKAFPDLAISMKAFLGTASPSTPTAQETKGRYRRTKAGTGRRMGSRPAPRRR